MNNITKINCNYRNCVAGMAVMNSRHCFLQGDYRDVNCQQFTQEREFEKKMNNERSHLKDTGF